MKKFLSLNCVMIAATFWAADISSFYAKGANGVFHTDMPVELSLTLKTSGSGMVKVFNRAGKLADEKKLNSPGGKTVSIKLPPHSSGFYRCVADFGGKKAECSFISTAPMKRRDPFFTTRACFFPKESHESYVRMGFGGLMLNNGFPYYDLKRYPDDGKLRRSIMESIYTTRLLEVVGKYDFHYTFHLGNEIQAKDISKVEPEFSRMRKIGFYPYSERLAQRFVTKMEILSELFGRKVKDWVFVSEVDAALGRVRNIAHTASFEISHYVTGARLAYNILKKAHPDIQFGLMPTCGHDYFRDTPKFWLTKLIMGDMEGKFDYNALDAYNGNYNLRNGPIARPEDGLRQYLVDARALNREYGKDGAVSVEERQLIPPARYPYQGETAARIENHTLRESIIMKSVRGCKRYAFLDYAWKADMSLFKYLEDEKGHHVRNPFPAAMGFSTLMRFLCLAEPARKPELVLPHGLYVYFFRRDGKNPVCFWTAGTREFDFAVDFATPYTITDYDGAEKAYPAGKTVFRITNAPILLTCAEKSPRKVFEAGKIANMPDLKGEARLLTSKKVGIMLANQLDKPLTVNCGTLKIPLKPNELKLVSVPRPAGKITLRANGRDYKIPSNFNPLPIRKIAPAPIDGKLSKYKTVKTIALKFPENLYPKAALIPERALILHDGKDIEVKLYIARDDKYLRIAAEVRDRIHINNFKAADLWRGDGLQLGVFPANNAWSPEITGSRKNLIPFNMSAALTDSGVRIYDYVRAVTPDWPCVITRQGLYTTYELAIPWTALGIAKPVPGTAIALNAVFFDYLDPGKPGAQHWAALAPGLTGKQDPSKFKTFILE